MRKCTLDSWDELRDLDKQKAIMMIWRGWLVGKPENRKATEEVLEWSSVEYVHRGIDDW